MENEDFQLSIMELRNRVNAVDDTQTNADLAEEGSKEITALQSLVEAEADGQGQQEGVVAAIQRTATSAAAFYQQVQAWQRIPQAFASMEDDERELVASLSLRRWLNAELGRPGVLPGDDQLDEELVEYVAGLLDHPDFCQPDLLVLELHEFLGSNVNKIVLALWKFMIVEIGLRSVFKLETTKTVNKIQVESSGTSRAASPSAELTNAQPQSSDATAERDYKRRRASYRGKVGTKIGPAAYREMIQKHMIGLSLEMDRELVLGESIEFFMSRQCKLGGSTMGSLIFGGGDNQSSYLDERKSRRSNPQHPEAPEHGDNNIKTPDAGAAGLSYYAPPTAAQERRDRVTAAPGAVSWETLQQSTALAVVRRNDYSGSRSDYFANGMGGQDSENNQQRRTRRMFEAPGGSSFKLG
ncbi:uncharacterized protein PITG_01793 [Phytophthora infestans T30-4]|uniref:Uncharacterized protein n=1 Tax=Phytophthora infestans (strain T30-4) TaxID=403677 RepID=D0MU38_PHYIT|nr:uncharacterized protein PITG_01793 [Phytophthora infestans T30-4]EEY61485.1 conserved hypothetical protein [Phytophthora infestans T30-4]|eukprot:XP_002908402.1 conserved hypothetical protein [Phytophthora infestans T30-4]